MGGDGTIGFRRKNDCRYSFIFQNKVRYVFEQNNAKTKFVKFMSA